MFLSGLTLRIRAFNSANVSTFRPELIVEPHSKKSINKTPFHICPKTMSSWLCRHKTLFLTYSCAVNFDCGIPSTPSSCQGRNGEPTFRHLWICDTEKPRFRSHITAGYRPQQLGIIPISVLCVTRMSFTWTFYQPCWTTLSPQVKEEVLVLQCCLKNIVKHLQPVSIWRRSRTSIKRYLWAVYGPRIAKCLSVTQALSTETSHYDLDVNDRHCIDSRSARSPHVFKTAVFAIINFQLVGFVRSESPDVYKSSPGCGDVAAVGSRADCLFRFRNTSRATP